MARAIMHMPETFTAVLKTPKTTYCGIDLVHLSKKERRVTLVAEGDDDEITCDQCLRGMRGGFLVRLWVWWRDREQRRDARRYGQWADSIEY